MVRMFGLSRGNRFKPRAAVHGKDKASESFEAIDNPNACTFERSRHTNYLSVLRFYLASWQNAGAI